MKNFYIYFTLLIYFLIYFLTLTFNYIEGDDMSSILFHLMGRNPEIASRYASYQFFFDHILSIFPPNEDLLLKVSFSLCLISGFFITIYLTKLIALIINSDKLNLINIIIILLIPEIIFQSIIYNPSILSASILIIYHYYNRKNLMIQKKLSITYLFLNIVVYALAISIRLDLIYLVVFCLIDLFLVYVKFDFSISSILKKSWYYASSFLFSILLYYLIFYFTTEFDYNEILSRIAESKGYSKIGYNTKSLLIAIIAQQSIFNPLNILFLIIGLVLILKKKKYNLLILFLISIYFIPKTSLLVFPAPKAYIFSWLFLFIPIVYGFVEYYKFLITKIALIFTIVFIWFFSILINGNNVYGPNFTRNQSFELQEENNSKLIPKLGLLNSGFLVPTQEGPRSFYGYFFTLFRDWKPNFERKDNSMELLKKKMKNRNFCILKLNGAYIQEIELLRLGYTLNKIYHNNQITYIIFENILYSSKIILVTKKNSIKLLDENIIDKDYLKKEFKSEFDIIFYYNSNKVYQATQEKGNVSEIIYGYSLLKDY